MPASISPTKTLRMSVTLALSNRDQLDQLLAAQQDPKSPELHHWLTPAEFNQRFGPTDQDIAAVTSWLNQSGFTVDSTNAASHSIAFHSDAATAQRGFNVRIAATPDGNSFANLDDPEMPSEVASRVAAVHGLSNTVHHVPMAKIGEQLSAVKPDTCCLTNGARFFGPPDISTFYDNTAGNSGGTGADCIAVIEDSDFEGGTADAGSAAALDNQFGLPALNLTKVFATGGNNPGLIGGDDLEAELDVQAAHIAAPAVPITAYIGDDTFSSAEGAGLEDALVRAINDNTCGAISMSFSFCGVTNSFFQDFDALFAQAKANGQGVYIASGDTGAAALVQSGNACVPGHSKGVNELAGSPNTTGVGGTQFSPHYSSNKTGGVDLGHVAEKVWHQGGGAAGGGVSAVFAKPSFQTASTPADGGRDVPDVSFGASPFQPGYAIGFPLGGKPQVACCIGGTSLGAPYWAGISALAAQNQGVARVGNLNQQIYTLGAAQAAGLRDVKKGNNGFNGVSGFSAKKGYDRASGWGTPDVNLLVPELAP